MYATPRLFAYEVWSICFQDKQYNSNRLLVVVILYSLSLGVSSSELSIVRTININEQGENHFLFA